MDWLWPSIVGVALAGATCFVLGAYMFQCGGGQLFDIGSDLPNTPYQPVPKSGSLIAGVFDLVGGVILVFLGASAVVLSCLAIVAGTFTFLAAKTARLLRNSRN